jgi:YVTN family beta-propeller protein
LYARTTPRPHDIEFRVLGPLEVAVDGRQVLVGGKKERALLTLLLLDAGEEVSSDRLIDALWGERPPPTASNSLHVRVSRLRRELGDDVLVRGSTGYALRVEDKSLDLRRFERLVEEGRERLAAGDATRGAETLQAALALWRGTPLEEFAYEPFAQTEIRRLEELRVGAIEERIEADLELGRAADVVAELAALVSEHPLRERLRRQLMLALYRCGRQAEALEVYGEARKALREELGIDPSPSLQELHRQVLRQDVALDTPRPADRFPVVRRRSGALLVAGGGLLLTAVAAVAAVVLTRGSGAALEAVTPNSVGVVDARTNELVAQVPVGARPTAIAAGDGAVWVSNLDDRSVSRLDPTSLRTIRTTGLGSQPTGLAADGRAVWAATSAGRLVRLDSRFDAVTRSIQIPSGSLINVEPVPGVAVGGGSLWVVSATGVVRVDAATGDIRRRFETGNDPHAIAFGGGAAWVADLVDNTVTRIDPTGATDRIVVGNRPVAVAAGAGGVWVANELDDTVVRLNPETRTIEATIRVGDRPSGIAAGSGAIWVTNAGDGTLSRIDPQANEVSRTLDVGGAPAGVAVVDDKVWVTVEEPAPSARRGGGSMLVALAPGTVVELDPALSWNVDIGYATCLKLLNYPDRPGPAGSFLVPEATRSLPEVRDGGRTYVFTIRRGFRFSPPTPEPVAARTFAYSIERATSPRLGSPPGASLLSDVVGMDAYRAGKAQHLAGVSASGETLTIRLVRPSFDLPARIATSFFCAVPTDTPIASEGVRSVASAGPYYVSSYSPGRRIVLRPNPNYGGPRPRALDEIIFTGGLTQQEAVARVKRGSADYVGGVIGPLRQRLQRRFAATAAGEPRFLVAPAGQFVRYFALNASRPLFASARMRRAFNHAIDRRTLARLGNPRISGPEFFVPTDQYLAPGMPGFHDVRIYPFDGDVQAAKRLARGGRGTAVLYTCNTSPCPEQAEVLRANLGAMGIRLVVRQFPLATMYAKESEPNAAFDIGYSGWAPDYVDPAGVLDVLFGREASENAGRFRDRRWWKRLGDASRLSGRERYRVYGRLDAELARDAAPAAAWAISLHGNFYSGRIGCQFAHPIYETDFAALCLRSS